MKTQSIKPVAAVIAAITIGALNVNAANAEATGAFGDLIYNNNGYIYSIPTAPNPVPDVKVQNAEIVFVSLASGPAIYSYPSNVEFQSTAFNVQYTDTAYGPAIHSYPSNTAKAAKFQLNLTSNDKAAENELNRFITPASLITSLNPVSPAESNF